MKFFILLHTAERPKRVFYASAHCRKAKKKFFTLLRTAERAKRSFSRFCTLQKDQKRFFTLLHTAETPNETFSCFCTRQKRQMKLFCASAHDRNTIRRKEYALVRVGRTGFIIINQLLFIIQTFILLRYKVCGPPANHFLKGLAFPRSAKLISRKV